jgi:hypothetical protein
MDSDNCQSIESARIGLARLTQTLDEDDDQTIQRLVLDKMKFIIDRLSFPPMHIAEHLRIIASRKPHVSLY